MNEVRAATMLNLAAKALWERSTHPLLEKMGHPTDWESQPRAIKLSKINDARAVLSVFRDNAAERVEELERTSEKWNNEIVATTLSFWLRNRIEGISASMADNGDDIDVALLRAFDEARRATLAKHRSKR